MSLFDKSLLVSLCLVCLGWSSWITVNGVWAETPLLVSTLPEKWTLPSYIIVITQLANVGPLIYLLLHRHFKNIETCSIHVILWLGIVGSLLLSRYWDVTSNILGYDHSTAFFGLLFLFAIVDCTSSVLYIPYLDKLQSKFVFPLFIGEGLSGLIPSIISLIQGTHGIQDGSRNYNGLFFTVNTYFIILAVLLLISWFAFCLLNNQSLTNDFRRIPVPDEHTPIFNYEFNVAAQRPDNSIKRTETGSMNRSTNHGPPVNGISNANAMQPQPVDLLTPRHTFFLLILQAITSCFANSVLTGLQTYTAMPYGLSAYHLACNLALFASPTASLIAILFDPVPVESKVESTSGSLSDSGRSSGNIHPLIHWCKCFSNGDQRMLSLQISTAIQFLCAAYLLSLAIMHKHVPAAETWIGPTLMIIAWICFSFFSSLCKTLICSLLRTRGPRNSLFKYGIYTQVGSLVGAVPTFAVTNFTDYFI